MRRKRPSAAFEYRHPATYAEILQAVQRDHQRRIAELKAASRMIVAIESDLAALVEQRLHYSLSPYSMYLVDCTPANWTRRRWALRIDAGLWPESKDRFVSAFLARAWIVEEARADGRLSKVILRRPRTQIRVSLDCSVELATQLRPQPPEESA